MIYHFFVIAQKTRQIPAQYKKQMIRIGQNLQIIIHLTKFYIRIFAERLYASKLYIP